ncbi:MAG: hypothetical protein ACREVL_03430 [Solimonas sp.]
MILAIDFTSIPNFLRREFRVPARDIPSAALRRARRAEVGRPVPAQLPHAGLRLGAGRCLPPSGSEGRLIATASAVLEVENEKDPALVVERVLMLIPRTRSRRERRGGLRCGSPPSSLLWLTSG